MNITEDKTIITSGPSFRASRLMNSIYPLQVIAFLSPAREIFPLRKRKLNITAEKWSRGNLAGLSACPLR